MARIPHRLGALLLLAVFIGGGLGLPDADAFLFHSHTQRLRPDVAHVDLPGGCGAHAERCVLSAAVSPPQLGAIAPVPLRSLLVAFYRPFIAGSTLRSADRSFLHPSRAPPVPAC